MPKRPPFLRRRTLCIFCEGTSGASISHEHILPDWLHEVFPRDPATVHTFGITSWVGLSPGAPITKRHRKQGHVTTRQVRVVCEKCNNGWLSSLEDRTKPVLLALLRGERFALGPEEQLLLATWAAKTCMTAEFIDRSKIAIPQGDRTFLMHTLSPPQTGWWMWIAGSQGVEWEAGINHFSARLHIPPIPAETPEIVNLQSTTLGIGRLLLFAISTSFLGADFGLTNSRAADLHPIWPLRPAMILWPPHRLLTDSEIEIIARNVARAFGVPT
jgi:hypothetical protein